MEEAAAISVGLLLFAAGAETVRMATSPLNRKQTNGRKQYVEGMYWGLVFIGLFAGEVNGLVTPTTFVALGAIAFIRFFGTKHEANHFQSLGSKSTVDHVLYWGHLLLDVPASPIEMCQSDLTDLHKGHHKAYMPATQGKYPDPDGYMTQSWWPVAFIHCVFESEQAMPRHLWTTRGEKLGRTLAWAVYKTAVLGAVWYLTGTTHLMLWLLACRIGNGVGLFTFHTLLHTAPVWNHGLPFATGMPVIFTLLWRMLLGEDLLHAVVYHKHHHLNPVVPVEYLDLAAEEAKTKLRTKSTS